MTLNELKSSLSEISSFQAKVAYRAFPVGKAPKLPFIVYLVTGTDNFDADNAVYHVIQNVSIELYTAKKDVATEQKVEAKFAEIGLVWDKDETYLDDENCYEIIYSTSI